MIGIIKVEKMIYDAEGKRLFKSHDEAERAALAEVNEQLKQRPTIAVTNVDASRDYSREIGGNRVIIKVYYTEAIGNV